MAADGRVFVSADFRKTFPPVNAAATVLRKIQLAGGRGGIHIFLRVCKIVSSWAAFVVKSFA
jgi:hypothetical protein